MTVQPCLDFAVSVPYISRWLAMSSDQSDSDHQGTLRAPDREPSNLDHHFDFNLKMVRGVSANQATQKAIENHKKP